jgi:hypothetical protein
MKVRHVSRAFSFGPGIGLAAWGWSSAGDPVHLYGLAALLLLGLALWPLLVLVLIFGLPAAVLALWPRRWRVWWRHGQDHRPYIPRWFRRVVYAADQYECVYCGSDVKLQLDHVMPWSFGGLTSLWNTVTLCGTHNRIKSNYWQFRGSGRSYYRPFAGSDNKRVAAEILARELRCRHNPVRWIRAAWALGA